MAPIRFWPAGDTPPCPKRQSLVLFELLRFDIDGFAEIADELQSQMIAPTDFSLDTFAEKISMPHCTDTDKLQNETFSMAPCTEKDDTHNSQCTTQPICMTTSSEKHASRESDPAKNETPSMAPSLLTDDTPNIMDDSSAQSRLDLFELRVSEMMCTQSAAQLAQISELNARICSLGSFGLADEPTHRKHNSDRL